MSKEVNDGKKILRYDPMTGDPIYEEEPVIENDTANVEEKTDDESGEKKERKIIKYNPMTGEPIYEGEEEKKERKIIKYNPMTGEPVYEGDEVPGVNALPVKQGTVMSGKKVTKIIAVLAVLAVIVFIISQIVPWILLGKNAKFILAVKKSMEPGKLIEALDVSDTLKKGDYTVAISGAANGYKIDSEYASNVSKTEYIAKKRH